MRTTSQKNTTGFTLVETMITIAIFTIIMAGTSLMLRDIFSVNRQQNSVLDNTNRAQQIAHDFINEIRNSDYGADGSYPVGQVTTTQLIFYSYNQSTNSVYRIRYFITGNTLYKGTIVPTGTPGTYNTNNEVIRILTTKMSLGAAPLFYYYDGSYTGTGTGLTQPVNINQVKFIKMNLTMLKESVRGSTNTFTINAGGTLRNLKTNLGN